MNWNLADVFECVADAVPDREAVVCGGRRLTYAGLEDRANRLAHLLEEAGVGPGDRVALDLRNAPEYLEGMVAAFKLRAVPVNVNWRYTPDELRYLLEDAGAAAVVFHRSLADPLLAAVPGLSRRPALVAVDDSDYGDTPGPGEESPPEALDYEAALAEAPAGRKFSARSPDDLYLLYTGGTTGLPKGVMWRHEDVLRAGLLGSDNAGLSELAHVAARARGVGRRALPVTPLMHGTAQWAALSTLFGGGTVVLSPDRRLEPVRLWALVAAERVDYLALVGDATARPLVDALDDFDDTAGLDLSCLCIVVSSGAVFSLAVKEDLARHLPDVVVVDTYGSSETGPQARAMGGVRFVGDVRTVVLDEDLHPVPAGSGIVGRLASSGHVSLGYWGDPEGTAATFPVLDGVRYAVSGDHATVEADGTITVFGRGTACINTGGEKVYPEEVEAVLKAHPDVFDAIVVGVPEERWGEQVVAVVQARDGRRPEQAVLSTHARRSLAGYKVPRAVVLVDGIHRSVSGKPDYGWAREEALRQLG